MEPLDFIDIVVVPLNADGTQIMHHTSGKYYILSLEDTIDTSGWTTKLSLIKNVNRAGTTQITINKNTVTDGSK